MGGSLPTSAVVAIGVFLVTLAVVGLLIARRRLLIGSAIVVVALVGAMVVADDYTPTILLVVGAGAMGMFVESRARAETPEARRRLTVMSSIFGVLAGGALVLLVLRDLRPPTTQELSWRALGGSVEAALALADAPDEELKAFCSGSGLAEDLAKTVDAMADRETMAGRPSAEDQERLRALSQRIAEIASENDLTGE